MVSILGTPMFEGTISSAVELVCEEIESNNKCISATGAHGMIEAKKNSTFRKILKNFYLNLPDGMPGVWVGKMKGAKIMERCYGPDFFKLTMINSAPLEEIKHFFCGGMEGVAINLKRSVENKFNNYNVVGTYCPPFKPVDKFDYSLIAERINSSNASIVWIGLSTPKQEQFAHHLSKHTKVKHIITVGAAFDFHIGKVKQAPNWMQRIGMEWFFRLLMEPKRLWKRYFEIVPLFIYYNFVELIKGEFFKK
jgi:N-acetylglucosaminyldiphosphoundecaprenol N-acetyl-beta-D-mannosaminyltransferase